MRFHSIHFIRPIVHPSSSENLAVQSDDFIVTISLPEFTRWQTYVVDLNLGWYLDHLPSYIGSSGGPKNVEVVEWLLSSGCSKDTDQIMSVDHVPIVYM